MSKKPKRWLRLSIALLFSITAIILVVVSTFFSFNDSKGFKKSKDYANNYQITLDLRQKNSNQTVTEAVADEAANDIYKILDGTESKSPPKIEISSYQDTSGGTPKTNYRLIVTVPDVETTDEVNNIEDIVANQPVLSFYSQNDVAVFNENGYNSAALSGSPVAPDFKYGWKEHTDTKQNYLFKDNSAVAKPVSGNTSDNQNWEINLTFSNATVRNYWNAAAKAFNGNKEGAQGFIVWLNHDNLRDLAFKNEKDAFAADNYNLYNFMHVKGPDGKTTNIPKENQYNVSNYLVGVSGPSEVSDNKDKTNLTFASNLSKERANEIAARINFGLSDYSLNLESSGYLKPTLGTDAFNISLIASGIVVGLVLIFMIANYGVLGVISALGTLLFLVISLILVRLMGTEYSPEIIGAILLGVAIATDVNILTFERLKSEIYQGFSPAKSINKTNRITFLTIFDMNVLLLIIMFIMFFFGHELIKGFSVSAIVVTVSSLIVFSLFTKIASTTLVSTGIFEKRRKWLGIWNEKKIPKEYQKSHQPKHYGYNYLKISKKTSFVSLSLISIGVVVYAIFAGISGSFLGGLSRTADYQSRQRWSITEYQNINNNGINRKVTQGIDQKTADEIVNFFKSESGDVSVDILYEDFPTQTGEIVREISAIEITSAKEQFSSSLQNTSNVQSNLNKFLSAESPNFHFQSNFSASVRNELATKLTRSAFYVSLGIILAIAVYVLIRFSWTFGFSIIAALAHDGLIISAVFIIFRISIDTTTVVGIIVGMILSLNEKVVLFDRIRDNMRQSTRMNESYSKDVIWRIANRGIGHNIRRSILFNGLMLIIALVFLFAFGGISITFGISILVAVVSSFMSSIFIGPWFWVLLETYRQKRMLNREKNQFWKTKGIEEQTIESINDFQI